MHQDTARHSDRKGTRQVGVAVLPQTVAPQRHLCYMGAALVVPRSHSNFREQGAKLCSVPH